MVSLEGYAPNCIIDSIRRTGLNTSRYIAASQGTTVLKDLLSSSATLHFGLNRESLMDLLLEVEFHRIIVIDTQEYIQTVCATTFDVIV